jgi:ankyrin repeat protein
MSPARQNNVKELNGITLSMLLGDTTPSVEEIHKILDQDGHNCNFEYRDAHGQTCLQRALANRKIPDVIYRKIFDLGGKPDVIDTAGVAAIVLAAGRNDLYCVEKMVEKGADINAANSTNGATPLTALISSVCNKFDIEKMVSLGADVNRSDAWGVTPLMEAAIVPMNPAIAAENIHMLYKHGANPLALDSVGLCVLDHAEQNNSVIVIQAVKEILSDHSRRAEESRQQALREFAENATKITQDINAPTGVTVVKKTTKLRL